MNHARDAILLGEGVEGNLILACAQGCNDGRSSGVTLGSNLRARRRVDAEAAAETLAGTVRKPVPGQYGDYSGPTAERGGPSGDIAPGFLRICHVLKSLTGY